MAGDKSYKQIKVPLDEHQQILIQRYIDAELQVPDFIAKGLSNQFLLEVFLYIYYAGHGCLGSKQQIVLNETEVEKIFWPAESKIKLILKRSGSICKTIVVFDCCREDFAEARDRVIKAHAEIKAKQVANQQTKA